MLYTETLIQVHVKINLQASVLNMNCCRALIVNLQNVFCNSQASVGDRQYIIISPDATILNYLNNREGAPLSFVGFWRPQFPYPLPDSTIPNDVTLAY